MFKPETFSSRRENLKKEVKSGVALFMGNVDVPFNYPHNIYRFRQDSHFRYFFGLDQQGFVGVIDLDNNKDILFGNDVDIEDIIWTGPLPSVKELAATVGIDQTGSLAELDAFIKEAIASGRQVHFLPPYRGETIIQLSDLLGIHHSMVKSYVSEELIRGVVTLKSIKSEEEVAEIEKAVNVAYEMHTTAMKTAKPGLHERDVQGKMEGISLQNGGPTSFPIICSINGQTLHNNYYGNELKDGRLMVCDAGAEIESGYTSDITRTFPVNGKFSDRQKAIYEVVLEANIKAIEAVRPGIEFRDCHYIAAEVIFEGLKKIGLVKGDTKEAVKAGAHTLFYPHGLGHMMGMDVHDMEGLGETFVGYDEETKRSTQFGTAFLRLGRKLEPGFVITVEPGLYFIPELIDLWKKENKLAEFINYDVVETYKDFGGVRIEDDILVTESGYQLLGKPIPKTVEEIESIMSK